MNQGLRFKKSREFLGYSQQDTSTKTGLSQRSISLIENNKVSKMNMKYAYFLFEQGINMNFLETGEGEMLNKEISSKDQTEWKEKFEEEKREKEQYKEKVSRLEKTLLDIQSKMNLMYGFLLQNSDKLDLSKLDLGKHKTLLENGFVASAKVVRMPTGSGYESGNVLFGN